YWAFFVDGTEACFKVYRKQKNGNAKLWLLLLYSFPNADSINLDLATAAKVQYQSIGLFLLTALKLASKCIGNKKW
ncbi:MAG: hypothetical protein AAFX55_21010, partial [Bacteroidota bacterium]